MALPAPPGLRAALATGQRAWRETEADVSWADPALAHVTLRFLGAAPGELLARLDGELVRVAARHPAVAVRASATGAFPGWGRPRILWLGLEAPGLAELAGEIEAAARNAGFAAEDRPFHAHVTIGRVRGPRGQRAAVETVRGWRPEGRSETVGEIVLYRSDLDRGGPRYTPIESYALMGSVA